MKERKIQDVMTVFPNTVEPETSLVTVLKLMQRYDVRHLPVVDASGLLGVAFERDVRMALKFKGVEVDREPIRDYLEKAGLVVKPEETLHTVLKEMLKKKLDYAVVANGTKIVGIFTCTDAVKLLLD